jgi:nucleoside phosphorylase/CheY-like chemotaxis protein
MIKILIVEDNPVKIEKVSNLFKDEISPKNYSLKSVNDIKSAKELLYSEKFDVIILDLVLPIDSEDKDPDAEKGADFLDDIYDNPSIVYKPIHIIGLTAFSDIKPQYEKKFHRNLNHLIDYKEESYNWKEQLKNFMWRLIEKEDAFYMNRTSKYNFDIGIIVATEKEFSAVKRLSDTWSKNTIPNDPTVYWESVFKRNNKSVNVISTYCPQMGMNACAVLSMKLINNFRPKYLFMTGITASAKELDQQGYGDIIVFDETWDGGAGKITEDEKGNKVFLQEAHHIRLDVDIREKLRSMKDNKEMLRKIKDDWQSDDKPITELQIHIGSAASVAGVIENEAVLKEIKTHDRKLVGLDMEAFALYYASNNCCNPKPIPIVLKSISDFANTMKSDRYQSYASYTSSRLMYELIMNEF